MDQLTDFADDRLLNGCIYCGGPAETRDHVPSRILLDRPYPQNLPVVGACRACNLGFSMDEEYLVCILEAAIAGSADPDRIRRRSVAKVMRQSPALRARIEHAKRIVDDRAEFVVEIDRVRNVVLKLVRGHAAYELSQPCRGEVDHFWCGPLGAMSREERELFEAPHVQQMFGEVGSRGLQRMVAMEMVLQTETGEKPIVRALLNDWIEVQEGNYRYLAIDDIGGLAVRIVIAEYLACEVGWRIH